MFGYIKPYKPEMKIKEFETFKAVYCGLCKQLSHVFGPFSSLTLSYDFTFIAILALGMSSGCTGFKACRCVANPLKKKNCMLPSDDLTFCASSAMLMIYYKVLDNLSDESFISKIPFFIVLPFVSHARKKAAGLYGDIDTIIADAMKKQSELEATDCCSIDRAADPTATALALICERLSDDEKQKRILNRFGYLIGRYVYFADAADDLAEDLASKSYNPFLNRFEGEGKALEEIKEYAKGVLNLTIGEIPPAYELLKIYRYKEILDNIIYLGLHNEMDTLFNSKKQSKKERKASHKKEMREAW